VKFNFKRVAVERDALIVATVSKGFEKYSTSGRLHVAPVGRMEEEIWQFKVHFSKQMVVGIELEVAFANTKSR
jgi:hypothetical protein